MVYVKECVSASEVVCVCLCVCVERVCVPAKGVGVRHLCSKVVVLFCNRFIVCVG